MSRFQDKELDRLEWAIWLSQVDVQTLREGDWINLAGDLANFIEGSGGLTDLDRGSIGFYGLNRVKKLVGSVQSGLKEQFEKLAAIGEIHVISGGQKSTRKLSAISFLINGRIEVEAFEGEPYRLLMKANTITTQASAALASCLVSSGIGAGQVRKCPTCKRIFLLKRKPRPGVTFHCSLKCSRLEATRRYRKKKASKLNAKERERSHRRYVAKQRKKHGANVNVRRIPRKTIGG